MGAEARPVKQDPEDDENDDHPQSLNRESNTEARSSACICGYLSAVSGTIDDADTASNLFGECQTRKRSSFSKGATMTFKYSFNTWCYSCFPVWVPSYSIEEAARRIARAGYDALEIGCAAPIAWPAHLSKMRRVEIKEIINGEGLAISSLLPAPGGGPGNNPTSILPEERAATIAHYKEVVDLAHDLGSSASSISPAGAPMASRRPTRLDGHSRRSPR